ncbi:MAG: hypothetical protein E7458_05840 [Ruminococcaceae bacterium]|nr:hypothetical protein [Oscillospiraceae bacterium]
MNKKKSHLFLKAFLLIFTVYALFHLIDLRGKISDKQEEIEDLNRQIYEQQVHNQQLRESADEELTEAEIADIARQKLGYAYPGERVFIDITGK